jgi:hypothetical protein
VNHDTLIVLALWLQGILLVINVGLAIRTTWQTRDSIEQLAQAKAIRALRQRLEIVEKALRPDHLHPPLPRPLPPPPSPPAYLDPGTR